MILANKRFESLVIANLTKTPGNSENSLKQELAARNICMKTITVISFSSFFFFFSLLFYWLAVSIKTYLRVPSSILPLSFINLGLISQN